MAKSRGFCAIKWTTYSIGRVQVGELYDKTFMALALELAERGLGFTSPNPMVGAVVVSSDGEIIGSGWHEKCGEAHAEVNAVRSVADQSMLCGATLYVTLEPCAHFGRTPPCADMIVDRHIPRVVVACEDPFAKVAGRGIERMRHAGIDVVVGVMESEARELNRRFFTSVENHRPYIILKWAQSADGAMDIVRPHSQPPAWMTGEGARKMVHQWRGQEDAIMVGRRTAELDNPELTVRAAQGRNPVRVVVDQHLALPSELKIFNAAAPTILFTAADTANINYADAYKIDYQADILPQILDVLHSRGIQSIIVEGGAQLLQSFIAQNLWDEARIFTADRSIGAYYPSIENLCPIMAPHVVGRHVERCLVDVSSLEIIRNC